MKGGLGLTIEMELVPTLSFDLYNGWVLFAFFLVNHAMIFLLSSRKTVSRLTDFDFSKWETRQRISFTIGKMFSLICIVLILFTPLRIGSLNFWIGLVLLFLGIAGLDAAVIAFNRTPTDTPITSGPYRFSRHPQQVALFTIFAGISLAIGSWIALGAHIIARLLNSACDRAEEQACLEYYGEPYQEYLDRTPRYLLY
ncbi:isoprenylcysteine carboxylmethyltransferase family protein [Candidatus Thorarchaeota archaeon]|nr:MAG: isoprenylcysteine carboxylmethyltransferase family protein [Candidatus Thorarchaeota archaeon]